MAKATQKIKIMVGSTVYGFEDQLSQLVAQLQLLDYDVLNSYNGSIKVNPNLSNLDNCLNAVKECDLFLGIIRPYYGTGNIGEKNITFEEIKLAIKLKKPYWFLVHRDVVFSRLLFSKMKLKSGDKIVVEPNRFFDERTIEIYEYVIKNHEPVTLRNGNWAQEFYRLDEMMTYINTQFTDMDFVQNILNEKTAKMENSFIIENLLEQQEGNRLEFKATVNKEAIAKTIAAFINTQGGDLLIGVEDNKKIVGVENAEKVCASIQKMLVEYIQPIAPIFTQVVNYKKKDLILISVWEGAKKPYQFKGKIFTRENDATKLSSVSNLTSLIKDRKEADFHWERRTVLGSSLQDLDTEEINQTIALYKAYKPNSVIEDAEDFLIQMGLIQNGNLTNACMVLFGKKPTRFIPQSKIRITIYPSTVSGDNFLNDKTFDGSLFQNITAILNFIEISFGKNIVVDGILRKEKYNYPLMAVREGLLNAMVHRDYNSVNGFLQISIFSDRTEISNYGGLPAGITIKDLKKEHNSILRNPDIAQTCFIRKYIEMLGSGTLRMISDCKKNGFRIPVWTDKDNVTTVTFPDLSIKTKATKGVNEGVNEGVKKVHFKAESEGVNEELNAIYSVIEKTPGLKAPAIASALGVSLSTAERYIKKLKDAKYIKFVGVPKTGGYFIK